MNYWLKQPLRGARRRRQGQGLDCRRSEEHPRSHGTQRHQTGRRPRPLFQHVLRRHSGPHGEGTIPFEILVGFFFFFTDSNDIYYEKVKEFFQDKCNTTTKSSRIDESGYDASEILAADPPAEPSMYLAADAAAEEAKKDVQDAAAAAAAAFKMNRRPLKSRHTLATVDHSTPAAKSPKTNDFTRVTATVKKKISPASGGGPIIKTSRSSIYFGGCKGRSVQREFTIVNSRSSSYLMELRFKDCKFDDFKIVDGDGSHVSQLSFPLDRNEKRTVSVVFQTRRLGAISSTLNIYPRSEATKHIKYSIALAGYGGSSHVEALVDNPEKILVPRSVAAHYTCHFALENRGTVPAFTCIQASTGIHFRIIQHSQRFLFIYIYFEKLSTL